MLGRPFVIEGKVEYGNQLGRTLGYPTANIHLRSGSARCMASSRCGSGWAKANAAGPAWPASGCDPTVNEVSEPLLEVHLFDFEGDLYGQRMAVEFVAKLRDEQKFDGLEPLKTQMALDSRMAREVLGMNPAAGPGVTRIPVHGAID